MTTVEMTDLDQSWEVAEAILCEAAQIAGTTHPVPGAEVMRAMWQRNKEWMFPAFDELGRVSTNVELDILSKVDIDNMFCDVYEHPGKYYDVQKYQDVLGNHNDRMAISYLQGLLTSFPISDISRNRISSATLPDPSRPGKFLQAGTRLSAYIKLCIMYDDYAWDACGPLGCYNSYCRKELADMLVEIFSRFVATLKQCHDIVVLSINPVDMLLASCHTAGDWRSCHNLFDGQCCTGPVSYLLDGVSAIAYAYRSTDIYDVSPGKVVSLPRKIWREMVFLHHDSKSAYLSREYPCPFPAYAKTTRKLAAEVLRRIHGVAKLSWTVRFHKGGTCTTCEEPDHGVLTTPNGTPWHYVDYLVSQIRLKPDGYFVPYIHAGVDAIPCVRCGSLRDVDPEDVDGHMPYPFNAHLLCEECESIEYKCDVCGGQVFGPNVWEDIHGIKYCYACWISTHGRCEDCGSWQLIDSMVPIHTSSGDHYWVCSSCAENYVACSDCARLFDHKEMVTDENGRHYCPSCAQVREQGRYAEHPYCSDNVLSTVATS